MIVTWLFWTSPTKYDGDGLDVAAADGVANVRPRTMAAGNDAGPASVEHHPLFQPLEYGPMRYRLLATARTENVTTYRWRKLAASLTALRIQSKKACAYKT